jgi:hypothetical protein
MKISLLWMNNSFFRWQKAYFHQLQPHGSSRILVVHGDGRPGLLEPFFLVLFDRDGAGLSCSYVKGKI